jgi:hypothetical protein
MILHGQLKPRLLWACSPAFAQQRHLGIGGCSPEQKDSDNANQTSESHYRTHAKTQRQRFGVLQPFRFGFA